MSYLQSMAFPAPCFFMRGAKNVATELIPRPVSRMDIIEQETHPMIHLKSSLMAAALGLTLAIAPVASFAQQPQEQFYVNPGVTLNGRQGPGTNFGKIQSLKSGTSLSLVKKEGDWAQVKTPEGTLLWVALSYLTQGAPQVQKAPQPQQPPQKAPQPPMPTHP